MIWLWVSIGYAIFLTLFLIFNYKFWKWLDEKDDEGGDEDE